MPTRTEANASVHALDRALKSPKARRAGQRLEFRIALFFELR
jgi:hypothetical protein